LADQTGGDVIQATGCHRDDDTHWTRWIGLRPRDAWHQGKHGSARRQIQKLSAVGKFHDYPPNFDEDTSRVHHAKGVATARFEDIYRRILLGR
jgi:hypothetical protein